jgi:hypothetical protein
MARTVNFDNQLGCRAVEIGDVRTDRMLPTKLEAVGSPPQCLPE